MKPVSLLPTPLPARVWQPFLATTGQPGLYAQVLDTPVGHLLAIATDNSLVLCDFLHRRMLDHQLTRLVAAFPFGLVQRALPLHLALAGQLQAYFEGASAVFDLPLQPTGTPFELRLWERLLTIAPGETRSYGALSDELGLVNGARAVGRANGSNALAIVIPCHRVIETGGGLGGYAGGLDAKRRLLQLERQHYATAQQATLFG